jgi:U3 small nucleolar RNA-associated protein 6
MQRALRMNPAQPELYYQYIRLELLYMLKLRERRVVLDRLTHAVAPTDAAADKAGAAAADSNDSGSDDSDDSDAATKRRESKRKRDLTAEAAAVGAEFFQAAVPRAVFASAIVGAL